MTMELSVRLKADGSGLVGEVRAGREEIDRLAKSAETAQARLGGMNAQQRLLLDGWKQQGSGIRGNNEALAALDDELAQFMSKVSPAYNAVKQLDTGHDLLTRSLHAGLVTQKQYDDGLAKLQAKYGPAAGGAKELAHAHEGLAAHSHVATRETVHLFEALASGGMEQATMQAAMLGAGLGKIGTGALLGGGLAIVAIGGVVAAIVKGHEEMERMNTALAITGGFAGMTRGQMEGLAASISRTGTLTVGTSKDIVTAIVASGRYGAENVAALSRLVDNYAAATGTSADKAAGALIKMFEDPAKASEQLNRSYHYLSVSELERIRTLEATGRTQEAVTLAIQKLDERLPQHAQNLGTIERIWVRIKQAASDAVDAMSRLGKEPTIEEQIAEAEKTLRGIERFGRQGNQPSLEDARARLEQLRAVQAEDQNQARRSSGDIARAAEVQATLEKGKSYEGVTRQLDALQKAAKRTRDAIANTTDPKAIELLRLQLAGINRQMAEITDTSALLKERAQTQFAIDKDALDRGERYLKEALDRGLIDYRSYYDSLQAMRERDLDAQIAKGEQELRAAQMALARTDPAKAAAARAQVEAADAAVRKLRASRPDIAFAIEQQRTPKEALFPGSVKQTAAEIEAEDQYRQQSADENAKRQNAAVQYEIALADQARSFHIGAIADVRARRVAEFDEQVRLEKRKVDAAAEGTEERKNLERHFGEWMVGRQAQLTEDLKPEWQNMLDAWSDNNRLMRESFDNFVLAGLRAGEDMFVKFARTGKLAIKDVADFVVAETARIYYRENMAQPLATGLKGLGGMITGWFGGGKSSGGTTSMGAGDVLGTSTVGLVHSGGVIGTDALSSRSVPSWVFAGARRMHGGGIASDEVPAILRRGEGVFTPQQMQALGGGRDIKVEIVNAGTPQQVTDVQPRVDVRGMVIRVLLDDQKVNGPVIQGYKRVFANGYN